MRLTAQSARDLLNMKKESFFKSLSIIRQMCDTLIKDASRRGKDMIQFDVPPSVFARESYDPRVMGRALAEQLYEDGFNVTGSTLHLKISWADEDSEETKDDEGIRASTSATMPMPIPFSTAFTSQLRSVAAKPSAASHSTSSAMGGSQMTSSQRTSSQMASSQRTSSQRTSSQRTSSQRRGKKVEVHIGGGFK